MIEVLAINENRERYVPYSVHTSPYRYYILLSKFRVAWKGNSVLYWEHVKNVDTRLVFYSHQINGTKRKIRNKAKKLYPNMKIFNFLRNHKRVTMGEAEILSGIPKPYCMDWLMEQDHPFFGSLNLTTTDEVLE